MPNLYDLYEKYTNRGPYYKSIDSLPLDGPARHPVRYLAYYLPQFHEIPENNEWWGAGFTEWTNTTKAIPRYVGHYQPRLPEALGFYNLTDVSVIKRQIEIAKRGGIFGFCIHHYWFSGRQILESPLQTILSNIDIDIPFCLNWANESWSRRWDSSEDDILLEQKYADGDQEAYVECFASAFRDPRYIRIDGRPILMIYRPKIIPDLATWLERWRDHFDRLNLGDPYLVMPQAFGEFDPRDFGMDAAAGFPPHGGGWDLPTINDELKLLDAKFKGVVRSYSALADICTANKPREFRLFPGVCPQWDNEARKPRKGVGFHGGTPEKYGKWLRQASEFALRAPNEHERIVFINAWNEWAEGAYLEPDRHFGCAYLAETRKVLDGLNDYVVDSAHESDHHDDLARAPARKSRSIGKLIRAALGTSRK